MRNLEQLRAQHALQWAVKIGKGTDGGEIVKKVPTMIMSNGFIGAMAFALEKGSGYLTVFDAVIDHLKVNQKMNFQGDAIGFFNALCKADSSVLRMITAEAMAYLNYLRRFAKPGKDDEQ